MDKKSRTQLLHQKSVFCSINSIAHLCQLLRLPKRKLLLLAQRPPYRTFTVPKKSGGERLIEAPGIELKKPLAILNRYLQSVYFFEKPSAAYGFIAGVKNDDDRRNVVTNARKHIGRPHLLNVDLSDFFHAVSRERVYAIFARKPFEFTRDLPDLLADLTTYQGRLPMGTPTSPVLSNFACREMDELLQHYAQDKGWAYTRYADDMSFSSHNPITRDQIDSVRTIIRTEGFEVNESKVKLFGPNDDKIVTGLLLGEKEAGLAPGFLPHIKEEIRQLQSALLVQNAQGELSTRWVEQQKRQVMGRLSFAGFVLKRGHPDYIALKDAYHIAINPPAEEFGAVNWRGFPYNL